jgi:biotin operon repressor
MITYPIYLNINESAVQKHIDKLKEKGILVRKGTTRGYWQINIPKNKGK